MSNHTIYNVKSCTARSPVPCSLFTVSIQTIQGLLLLLLLLLLCVKVKFVRITFSVAANPTTLPPPGADVSSERHDITKNLLHDLRAKAVAACV